MKKLIVAIFSVVLVFAFTVQPTFAAVHKDMNCKDFKTWQAAQKYFEAHGGSKYYNYDDLDRDHDGLACERNKGFNPHYKNPNNYKHR